MLAYIATLALAFPAVFVNLGHGHNGFLTAALIGFALLWLDRRPVVAGILFGLLAYKPQFGLMIPLVLSNLIQAVEGPGTLAMFKRFWPLIICVMVGTFIGTMLFARLDRHILLLIVGVLALIAVLVIGYVMWRFRLPPRGLIAMGGAAIYLISPIDVVPEAIFGPLGLVDDAGVAAATALFIYKLVKARRILVDGGVDLGRLGRRADRRDPDRT